MRILAFEVTRHLLELRFRGDGIKMCETEAQRPAVGQKLWALKQSPERGLKVRAGFEIRSDGESSRSRCRVNQVQVVGHRDPTSTGDLQDLVFDVAIECNVCEGRWRLGSGRGVGVELPLVVLVAEDELSSLVGGGVDNH